LKQEKQINKQRRMPLRDRNDHTSPPATAAPHLINLTINKTRAAVPNKSIDVRPLLLDVTLSFSDTPVWRPRTASSSIGAASAFSATISDNPPADTGGSQNPPPHLPTALFLSNIFNRIEGAWPGSRCQSISPMISDSARPPLFLRLGLFSFFAEVTTEAARGARRRCWGPARRRRRGLPRRLRLKRLVGKCEKCRFQIAQNRSNRRRGNFRFIFQNSNLTLFWRSQKNHTDVFGFVLIFQLGVLLFTFFSCSFSTRFFFQKLETAN
jgi:hypothetical protein